MFVDSDGQKVKEADGEQKQRRERVHISIETLDQLLQKPSQERGKVFFCVPGLDCRQWGGEIEVLEGGGEGNRGRREDKAGCNDVAFNYLPISPDCLTGQPLHNQDTHTHIHTLLLSTACAVFLKQPTGNVIAQRLPFQLRRHNGITCVF